jgi:hypothetical protein
VFAEFRENYPKSKSNPNYRVAKVNTSVAWGGHAVPPFEQSGRAVAACGGKSHATMA